MPPIASHLQRWLDAARPLPEVAETLTRFYAETAPALHAAQVRDATDRVGRLLDRPIPAASATAGAIDRLRGRSAAAGLAWPPPEARTIRDLIAGTLYAATLPMTGTFPGDRAALADDPRSDDALLDAALGPHALHELCHGPARRFDAAPSLMALEAAAAWLGADVAPSSVFADPNGPHAAVTGLRQFWVLGRLLASLYGEDALTRLALGVQTDREVFGERLTRLLVVAEWQAWLRARIPPLAPDGREIGAWCKLVLAARVAGPWSARLDAVASRPPDAGVARDAPDLLRLAMTIPGHALADGWPSAAFVHAAALLPALYAVDVVAAGQVIARPRAPSHLLLDARRGEICAPRHPDGCFGEPARIPFPTPLPPGDHDVVELPAAPAPDDLTRALLTASRPAPLDRTVVEVPLAEAPLGPGSWIVLIGSCFAENLAGWLAARGVSTHANPTGILYDPLALRALLDRLIERRRFTADDAVLTRDGWVSFDQHPLRARADRDAWLEDTNAAIEEAADALDAADLLVITLGTARAYTDARGASVANCHGRPGDEFSVRRLDPTEIADVLAPALARWAAPGRQVVLTVSPVRHLADGLIENSRSKAALTLAAEQIAERVPGVFVFPAYEIVLDEVRDYAAFHEDLTHPSGRLVEHVARRFVHAWFDAEFRVRIDAANGVLAALARPDRADLGARYARARALSATTPGVDAFLSPAPPAATTGEDVTAPVLVETPLPPDPPDPFAGLPTGWIVAADTAALAARLREPAAPDRAERWFFAVCEIVDRCDDADGALEQARWHLAVAATEGPDHVARWLTIAPTPCPNGPVPLAALPDDRAAAVRAAVQRRWPRAHDAPAWLRR